MHLRKQADSFSHVHEVGRLLVLLCAGAFSAACGEGAPPEAYDTVSEASSTIYQVGPARKYKDLGQVASLLVAGDVVEIDGNATYPAVQLTRSGATSSKITIRGLRVDGKRPVFSGGNNTIEVYADHYVLEGLDITAGSARCFFHHGHDVTLRDSVVHDCPAHGILGADSDSGSLTLDYVEVYRCGSGTQLHSIYVATDESAHPGSVFRMQHCYVHDANGGNAVKSRAERNEIYYNWIEGGYYKELELIGPDGQDPSLAREDSDVVGNVFRKTKTQYVVRVGGDGTGDTNGRYRFVNNTFLLTPSALQAFQLFDGIESIELHNNIFYRMGGGGVTIFESGGVSWSTGQAIIGGSNNWVPTGSSFPSQWTGTQLENDPGFVDVANRKVELLSSSPLIDAGATNPPSLAGHAFPTPLMAPLYLPPPGVNEAADTALARPLVETIDIGAFEYGTSAPPPAPEGSCVTAQASEWKNGSFTSKDTTFTAVFDVTPSATGLDGGVGLSNGIKTQWSGLAAIVRFSSQNTIEARNGGSYAATTNVTYTAGVTYHIRMVVNLQTDSYSVYVTPKGGSELLLADNYGFRTEQAGVPSLDSWDVWQLTSGVTLQMCNFALQ
jgi:hypothetical protein